MHQLDGWAHWLFGSIWMILFWIIVIAVIVLVVRWASDSRSASNQRTPLQILEERYARGEIDREKFERRKRDLTENS